MHDQARPVGIPTEDLTRAVGAVALAAVAVIHLVDLPGTMSETPLIGYGYYVLVGVALLGAFLLMTVRDRWVWALVDLTAFGAVVAYVLSRTTGLPTDSVSTSATGTASSASPRSPRRRCWSRWPCGSSSSRVPRVRPR